MIASSASSGGGGSSSSRSTIGRVQRTSHVRRTQAAPRKEAPSFQIEEHKHNTNNNHNNDNNNNDTNTNTNTMHVLIGSYKWYSSIHISSRGCMEMHARKRVRTHVHTHVHIHPFLIRRAAARSVSREVRSASAHDPLQSRPTTEPSARRAGQHFS